jgi:phospholipase/carboxylesterase
MLPTTSRPRAHHRENKAVVLEYEARIPDNVRDDAQLILLLHGRGANRHDLFPLAEQMPADAIVIAPEAPFPAAPWGYGLGSAWYQFLGGNRPEPDSFSKSLQSMEAFLRDLSKEMKFGKVVMGGFSQGGTVSIAYGLTHPNDVAGVLNFSGFLADHPAVTPRLSVSPPPRLSVFWGHGRHDPAIPFQLAIEGRAQLRNAGYDVDAHDYDIGHWIDAGELRDALAWLDAKTR